MKIIAVIGGGPAGMIASGVASKNGENKVILFEKNKKLGRKLFITGKGRCNVTNCCEPDELIENTVNNPYFLYSAYYGFSSYDTMEFFERLGVPLKVERGKRVFPVSDKSSDIVKSLGKFLQKTGVQVRLNSRVDKIVCKDKRIEKLIVDNEEICVDNVIIATGGLSYPVTGSDGDGHKFSKDMGHTVTRLSPSLVPLKTSEKWCESLQGLSLKNIELKIKINGKNVYNDFGEMMFTHFGITGPLVLKASTKVIHKYNEKIHAFIDLKPALSEKELDSRILRDFEKYKNKSFKNSLDELLPKKIIPIIISLCGIDENKKINIITKNERNSLISTIKNLKLTIIGDNGYDEAVVTAGGVCVDEIDPSTMKSKMIENLSFAGEVIDVDSYTGGFNLQIAFSTGYLAGNNI